MNPHRDCAVNWAAAMILIRHLCSTSMQSDRLFLPQSNLSSSSGCVVRPCTLVGPIWPHLVLLLQTLVPSIRALAGRGGPRTTTRRVYIFALISEGFWTQYLFVGLRCITLCQCLGEGLNLIAGSSTSRTVRSTRSNVKEMLGRRSARLHMLSGSRTRSACLAQPWLKNGN